MKKQKTRNLVNISVYTLIYLVSICWALLGLSAAMEYPAKGAQQALKDAIKECAIKAIRGRVDPIFSSYKDSIYKIIPENGSCSGDANGVISAVPFNEARYPKYPNYFIAVTPPYRKSCSHSGKSEELYGCSARENGTW